MVSVLGGQLGNQMFQYAAGRALAGARGCELLLYLPPNQDETLFACFPLQARRWNGSDRINRPYLSLLLRTTAISRLLKRMERLKGMSRRHWYENDRFNWDPQFEHLGDDLVMKGYWQSYRYFHHLRDSLRAELRYAGSLSPAATSMKKAIEEHPESIAVHVRRGEYVDGGWPMLSSEYFEKALRILKNDLGLRAPKLFVFSNDPEWCAHHVLPGMDKVIVSAMGTSPGEDLTLMSACRHILIGPSTFSWWAAYLSDRARSVLAPFRWFFHGYEGFRREDIYLPDWIVVRD